MVWYAGCEPWMLSILVSPWPLLSRIRAGKPLKGDSLPGKGAVSPSAVKAKRAREIYHILVKEQGPGTYLPRG